jgi:hypothetical protein
MSRSFSDTVREQQRASAEVRKKYLLGALSCMLNGEIEVGKLMLRRYVNSTIGFIALGAALGKSSKTLMQMLGPKGNPHIRNFFEIVAYLQKVEGTALEVIHRNAA